MIQFDEHIFQLGWNHQLGNHFWTIFLIHFEDPLQRTSGPQAMAAELNMYHAQLNDYKAKCRIFFSAARVFLRDAWWDGWKFEDVCFFFWSKKVSGTTKDHWIKMIKFDGWSNIMNETCLEMKCFSSITHCKTNMSPENQWLEGVFPIKDSPFLGDELVRFGVARCRTMPAVDGWEI